MTLYTQFATAPTSSGIIGRNPFLRRLVTLSSGTFTANAITAASAPLLTRLYSPADLGCLGTYMSLLGVLSVVAMLRYECSLPVTRSDQTAANLLALCIGMASGAGVLCGLSLWAVRALFPAWQFWPGVPGISWLLPVGVFGMGCYTALSFWSIRHQDFRVLAGTKITQSIGMNAAQLGGGLLGLGAPALVLGHILGQVGGVTKLVRSFLDRQPELLTCVSTREVLAAAAEYKRYPQYSAGAALLETGAAALPYLYLSHAYGSTVTGWYTLTQRFVFAPVSILSVCFVSLTLGELADQHRRQSAPLYPTVMRRLRLTCLIGACVFLASFFLLPPLIPRIFGAEWAEAAVCVRALSAAMSLEFAASSSGAVLEVLQRQDLHLLRGILRCGSVSIGIAVVHFTRANWDSGIKWIGAGLALSALMYALVSFIALTRHDALVEMIRDEQCHGCHAGATAPQ